MLRALQNHHSGQACVIPIILRACLWEGSPFAKIQALPKNGKPVTSWNNQDEAFTDVARGVQQAVTGLRTDPPSPRPQAPGPPHIFTGTAIISGQRAREETIVTGYVDGTPVPKASAQVTRGKYTIIVEEPPGASFVGKTVLFAMVDPSQGITRVAKETAIWQSGGARVLDLTAAEQLPDGTTHQLTPSLTHTFTGRVTSFDVIPLKLTAWIGDKKVGETDMRSAGGSYRMVVQQPPGVEFSGRLIAFRIGNKLARESATWLAGGRTTLNLTVY